MTKLLPVQEAALATARRKPGFLFNMDMGLGKTLVALSEFLAGVDRKDLSRLVVICPNSFKGGWESEINKHGLVLDIHVYDSTRHSRADKWCDGPFLAPPVLIMNYEALRRDKARMLVGDFCADRNVMLVCDESISLKGYNTQQTKAVHKIKHLFKQIRLLTGKAVTQGAHDLWGQLYTIGAHRGMNYFAFRNRFCIMGGWENRQVVGIKNEDELRALLKPISFEAKKKDWLPSLPDKAYTTRSYELNHTLFDHYREMEQEFLTWVDDSTEVMAEIALTKYGKLSQITAGFIHDNEGEPQWLVSDENNPRLKLLKEIVEGIDSKVCVAYRHKFVGRQLERAFLQLTPALIAGDMKPEQIEHEKAIFNTRPECRMMLLQVDSARYGHTLLGNAEDPCHTMIFYENTYSLNTRSQIEDRIHRIGQSNGCLYIDLVGTEMDRKVIQALQKKENVYQALFGTRPRKARGTWTDAGSQETV